MAPKTFSNVDMPQTPASSVQVAPDPASPAKSLTPGLKTVGFIGFNQLVKAILQGIPPTKEAAKKWGFPEAQYLISVQPGEADHEPVQDGFLRSLENKGVKPELLQGENVTLAMRSDLIILATPPHTIKTILAELRMAEGAVSGRILVSLAPGVTIAQIKEVLFSEDSSKYPLKAPSPCTIFRARPTTSARTGKSITSIGLLGNPPQEEKNLVNSLFKRVGITTYVPESEVDAAAVVLEATPGFLALVCEGIIEGAVAGGMTRRQAERMTMKALAGMSEALGPDMRMCQLREKLCAEPGTTTKGLIALNKAGVGGKISVAMWNCISADVSQNRKGS